MSPVPPSLLHRAAVCCGPVCGGMGLSFDVREALLSFFPEDAIRESDCMGLCDIGGAFSIGSCSYAGEDLDRLEDLLKPLNV